MTVLSFAKNKFQKFLSLSNNATPSAPGIFRTNQKKLPHKNSAKNNNSNYQNKFR